LVFWGILIRLTTGASWVDIEAIRPYATILGRRVRMLVTG
jgi:hypothetical protein